MAVTASELKLSIAIHGCARQCARMYEMLTLGTQGGQLLVASHA